MSANRHAADANAEALRLSIALQDLCAQAMLGNAPSVDQLTTLQRTAACVQYHTARTLYAVGQFDGIDRRDVAAVIPALATAPTPARNREPLEGMLWLPELST